MTPQEEQLVGSLVERVNQTQLTEKDPDAEALLARELGPNPDALYILAQTVLVQNMALEQAKAQIGGLQQQLQQAQQSKPAHATSFLGSLLGKRDPEPAPQPPAPAQYQSGYQPVNPQYTPAYGQPGYAQPGPVYGQPQYVPVQSGQPSFLRGAMQTAAGVAAGALAFEGVESLLHGGFGRGGYGWGEPGMGMGGFGAPMGMGQAGFERPVEETVINNNYYDDDRGGGASEHHAEASGFHDTSDAGGRGFDGGGAHLANADYRGGDGGNELDAANDAQTDDSSYDDQSGDDGGGYDDQSGDDGGGFDSGDNLL
ncbi:MAG: DUF2076 domain-containing protein [Acidobacteriaceae bacterium]|nr:DUF2076 domain-containing protein [Acidobacteriaceae bacterium]